VGQLAGLLDKTGSGGRGRRSGLSYWLRSHYDAFAAMLAEREPAWEDVATALAAMGLRDGTGQPPTAERMRKVWWDVQRAKAKQARRRAAVPIALGPGEIAPAVVAVPAVAASGSATAGTSMTRSEGGTAWPRLQLDIRPATPLHETPASAIVPVVPITPPPSHAVEAAAAAAAASSPSVPRAAEQLRRLSEQMDAARTPLPKIVP
jgi:hypothetical protein